MVKSCYLRKSLASLWNSDMLANRRLGKEGHTARRGIDV